MLASDPVHWSFVQISAKECDGISVFASLGMNCASSPGEAEGHWGAYAESGGDVVQGTGGDLAG
jgi:hypothetical protein